MQICTPIHIFGGKYVGQQHKWNSVFTVWELKVFQKGSVRFGLFSFLFSNYGATTVTKVGHSLPERGLL